MVFIIKNDKDKESFTKKFNSYQDARKWIIDHLDLSKIWTCIKK